MANIKVVQRKVNKSEEQPISVRYSHPNPTTKKNEDFFLATGVIISPQYFKDGKVITLPNAPELNQTIRAVVTRLEQAVRDIVEDSEPHEPEVKYVKYAYHKRPVFVESLRTRFETFKYNSLSQIEVLEYEIKELNDLIATKQAEIIELKKQTGTYRTSNLVELIEKMIEARTKDADDTSKGGKRAKRTDKEAKLTTNTINAYNNFLNVVKEWNPNQMIESVDKKIFKSFEKFCIKLGYYNNSINLFMQKFGATMAYYQKSYELSEDYKNYTFDLPLREEQVIYLTSEELKAFRNVTYTHWQSTAVKKYQMVKDLCLIMSETGLRLNDAILSKGDISNGYIIKRQSKTNGKVVIPFSHRVQSILEKYNYQMKVGNTGYFNNAFRAMLSLCDVPSLFEEVTVVNYSGHTKIETTKPKWEHCSAHSLRRSMINQCLLRGYRYDQITLLTGHKDFTVFQTYVDRNSTLEKLDEAFNYLNDVSQVSEAIMKVA